MGSGEMRIKGQRDVPLGKQSESVFNVSDLPLADYDWTKPGSQVGYALRTLNEAKSTA